MSLAKIIEVVAEGSTIGEAAQSVVDEASKTVHNIKGIEILRTHGIVENNKIVKYRVDAKVAFAIEQK